MDEKIGVIGLGYVGLPLLAAIAKAGLPCVGFDVDNARVSQLRSGVDRTSELTESDLLAISHVAEFSCEESSLSSCTFYIVTVPTPVTEDNTPDLTYLKQASTSLGSRLKRGDVVVFESTVFPGATEEVCVPIIEEVSGLKYSEDFYVGYSPERINPGDKLRPLHSIPKIISGSCSMALERIHKVYSSFITANLHKAPTIKVAEAAKVLENIQRDVNIALINEVHQIFDLMSIDTGSVIDAASTKWNFMNVKPGLVGGHCIGVDPHYLIHKSVGLGFVPNLVRNAREINEGMSTWLVNRFLRFCFARSIDLSSARILILGYTFKPNCPDTRNTKVKRVINDLLSLGALISVWDPLLESTPASFEKNIPSIFVDSPNENYDVGIICTPHEAVVEFVNGAKFPVFDFRKLERSF